MPNLIRKLPRYRRHKPTGQALVCFNGERIYLGLYNSPASLKLYDQLLATWLANGRQLPEQRTAPLPEQQGQSITVQQLAAAYNAHAAVYYRKRGKPTKESGLCARALELACQLYGELPADQFGAKCLDNTRQVMISLAWTRGSINRMAERIKRAWRWAVSQELLSPGKKYQSLLDCPGLLAGRTAAKESDPVQCVSTEVVQSTLKHLPAMVADMVQFQLLTGARPGEICQLRPMDLDRSSDVWVYTPDSHKTEHHNKQRTICIGPKAQQLLMPYLLRPADSHCFGPAESERKRRAEQHINRTTPLSCGNKPGSNCKRKPKRTAGDSYTVDSYRRAIQRAADKAKVKKWAPNQLRHSALTEIRTQHGLDAAQAIAGHSTAKTTQIYAELDLQKAIAVARQVG